MEKSIEPEKTAIDEPVIVERDFDSTVDAVNYILLEKEQGIDPIVIMDLDGTLLASVAFYLLTLLSGSNFKKALQESIDITDEQLKKLNEKLLVITNRNLSPIGNLFLNQQVISNLKSYFVKMKLEIPVFHSLDRQSGIYRNQSQWKEFIGNLQNRINLAHNPKIYFVTDRGFLTLGVDIFNIFGELIGNKNLEMNFLQLLSLNLPIELLHVNRFFYRKEFRRLFTKDPNDKLQEG